MTKMQSFKCKNNNNKIIIIIKGIFGRFKNCLDYFEDLPHWF